MDVLGPAFTSAGCEDLPLTTHCCLVGGWGAGLALEVPASIQVTAASPQNTSTMRPQKQLLLRTQGSAVGLEYWVLAPHVSHNEQGDCCGIKHSHLA